MTYPEYQGLANPRRSANVRPGKAPADKEAHRRAVSEDRMRKKPEMFPEIADKMPWADHVTAYVEAHLIVYVRLLDAAARDACPEEMARIALRIDPDTEPGRAKREVESHFKRARWMSERGYLDLLSR